MNPCVNDVQISQDKKMRIRTSLAVYDHIDALFCTLKNIKQQVTTVPQEMDPIYELKNALAHTHELEKGLSYLVQEIEQQRSNK